MSKIPPSETAGLPLFYRQPEPLSHARHRGLRLREGNLAFAAKTAYVPIMASEFAFAARDYPLLFSAATAAPVALLGLRNRNLFVTDGEWQAEAYVPAYVRRYPFSTVRLEADKGFAMVVDRGSERLTDGGQDGVPLFEAGGEPSDYTRQVLQFCEQFHADALMTEAFSDALLAQDGLLIERRADVTLPDGGKMAVNGFRIVDAERVAALDSAVVMAWHRKGWLGLIHFHLASLERFQNLLRRQSAPIRAHPEKCDALFG